MYKYLIIIAAVVFLFKIDTQAQCPDNIDFELGNFTNWTGQSGVNTSPPPYVLVPGLVAGKHTIMSGAGLDPNVPGLPVVSPNGGTYSVRLGNDLTGGEVDVLSTTFMVTPLNTSFYYEYAVVLQNAGHGPAEMPKFAIEIRDANGQTVNCGQYLVAAGQGVPGFLKYPNPINTWDTIEYKPWSGVNVDLSGYIGQMITVEFKTEDCTFSGHYGYAYIDLTCTGKLATIGALCQGDSVFQLVAPSGFASYLWQPGGFSGQSLNVANATPGQIYTVELTPFGNPNCKSYLSDTVDILLYETTSTVSSCPGMPDGTATLTLLNDLPSKFRYAWNTNPVQTTMTATGLVGGQYIVTIENSTGCLMYDTIQVSELPLMQLIPSFDSTTCFGGSDGQAHVQVLGGNGTNRYAWSTNPIQDTPSAVGLSKGPYSVTVTDSKGCQNTTSIFVEQPTQLQVEYFTTFPSCYSYTDGKIQLTPEDGSPPYQVLWNTTPAQTSIIATGLGRGSYSYSLRDSKGCQMTGTAILQDPPPVPHPVVFYDTICAGENAYLKALPHPDSTLKVFWYPVSAGDYAIGGGLTYKTEPLYSKTIFFADHEDADHCFSLPRVPVFVTVNDLPKTDFESDRTMGVIPDAIFSFQDITEGSSPIIERFWEFGDGITSTQEAPVHQYAQQGYYSVTLTTIDSLGCRNTRVKSNLIEVDYQVNLIVPNAFTPNGDGVNDFFRMEQKMLRSIEIEIFDRWGNMVFRSNDLGFRWDGSVAGQPLPEGTYVFHLKGMARDGQPVERSGSLTLWR